jgi:regulator of G-protein signaling
MGGRINVLNKDGNRFYYYSVCLQSPQYWATQNHQPDNIDYAVYLYKRSLRNKQKHGLEDYEMDALNRIKKQFALKWEVIVIQAEEQVILDV